MTTPEAPPAAAPGVAVIGDAALRAALSGTARGDPNAFEQLYTLTNVKLFSICRRVVGDTTDAEEALQDAFMKVWREAGRYDPARGRPMTWLITLTHRCAIDCRRRRSSGSRALDPFVLAGGPAPASGAPGEPLARCLRALGREDEALLRAAFFEGATYSEIAGRSATPLGTIKSRIRRALRTLAECLR